MLGEINKIMKLESIVLEMVVYEVNLLFKYWKSYYVTVIEMVQSIYSYLSIDYSMRTIALKIKSTSKVYVHK